MATKIFCLFVLAVQLSFWAAAADDCTKSRCKIDDTSLRFNVIGDFGGIIIWPYYSWTQKTVAKGMEILAQERNTHFQLVLGDNFYTFGVTSAKSHRFKDTFENVYKGQSLFTPWYIIAGNHDHYGNVTGEVAYTKKSSRWVFPSLYYTVRYQLSDATDVDFVMLDTITLCGNTKNLKNAGLFEEYFTPEHEPQGPDDVKAAEDQWAWLEDQLKASTAKYLFVSGHFPVYSVGEHGPTKCLVDRLQSLLSKYKVTAYLDGHDHSLQVQGGAKHLRYTDNGWTTDYVISGMGAKEDSSMKHEKDVPSGSLKFHYPKKSNPITQFFDKGGYVSAELTTCQGTFSFFDGENKPLHSFDVTPRY